MPKRRLNIKLRRTPAIQVTRVALGDEKCAYIVVADKKLNYKNGRSRIAYIGTTKNGASRIAASAAERAPDVLNLRGVDSFTERVVTCRPRQRVKSWHKLEAGLPLMHKEMFGEVPKCNGTFHKKTWGDIFNYFQRKRLQTIIEDLA